MFLLFSSNRTYRRLLVCRTKCLYETLILQSYCHNTPDRELPALPRLAWGVGGGGLLFTYNFLSVFKNICYLRVGCVLREVLADLCKTETNWASSACEDGDNQPLMSSS